MDDFNDDWTEEELAEVAHRWDEQYDSTHQGDYERYEYPLQREE